MASRQLCNTCQKLRTEFQLRASNVCGTTIHLSRPSGSLPNHVVRKMLLLFLCLEDAIINLCPPWRRVLPESGPLLHHSRLSNLIDVPIPNHTRNRNFDPLRTDRPFLERLGDLLVPKALDVVREFVDEVVWSQLPLWLRLQFSMVWRSTPAVLSELLCDLFAYNTKQEPRKCSVSIVMGSNGISARAIELRMFPASLDPELITAQAELAQRLLLIAQQGTNYEVAAMMGAAFGKHPATNFNKSSQNLLDILGLGHTADAWKRSKLECPEWNLEYQQSCGLSKKFNRDLLTWQNRIKASPLIPP